MSIRTKRTTKRSFAAVIAAALVASVLALVASPAGATAAPTATVRKSGADRYATAAAVADDTNTQETHFVLASGESWADGLSASALTGALSGTLMLTPGAALSETTLTKMTKMTAGNNAGVVVRVWIVGGTAAVSAATAATLTAAGYTVVRVAGADRYATADAVAAQVKLQGTVGSASGYVTCMLASGTSWADAAAASGFAFENVHPIFLTGPTLSAGTAAAIKSTGCQQIYILGGEAAVSASAATDAAAVSTVITTTRLSGADRYATAAAMATKFATVETAYNNSAVLVSGNDFADALSASQYAAATTSVILPVTTPMPTAISDWLAGKQATMADIAVVGGTTAVPAALVTAAAAAATIAKPTCVVTATDGADSSTVTWTSTATMQATDTTDSAVAGDAAKLTSFVRTSTSGAVATAASATYTYNATTGVNKTALTFGSANAAGDVIRAVTGAIVGPSSTTNVGCSTTVAAATAVPTATIWAPATAAAVDKVYIDWSANTNIASFNTNGSEMVHTPANVGATAATFADCDRIGSTYTSLCTVAGQPLAAGDTLTIAAGKFEAVSSLATKPVNAAISTTVVTDATKPYPVSATYSYTATGGALATLTPDTGTGDVKITARANTAAAGKAGNAYSVFADETPDGSTADLACSYNATTKRVTFTYEGDDNAHTAAALAALCNTNAAFSALFVASIGAAGALTADADVAAANLAGGTDVLTVTVTMSEEMGAANAARFTVSVITCTEAIKTVTATNNGNLTGVLQITCATNGTLVSGVNTMTIAANADTVDRNGNQVDTTGNKNVVAIFAG